jgi:hypothetical protein
VSALPVGLGVNTVSGDPNTVHLDLVPAGGGAPLICRDIHRTDAEELVNALAGWLFDVATLERESHVQGVDRDPEVIPF